MTGPLPSWHLNILLRYDHKHKWAWTLM